MNNSIYRSWADSLGRTLESVGEINDIPFLPISAFKTHEVTIRKGEPRKIFTSSGTTGSVTSKHFVYDEELYRANAKRIFESFYGSVQGYCFLALLPNYLERSGSSLISMVEHFIRLSDYDSSGFYLYNHSELAKQLSYNRDHQISTVLFGVSFALLDFLDDHQLSFPELIIIETGGMKGRKKEMTKSQLQSKLAEGFGVQHVHSEYGMTELFSQAYSKANGLFRSGISMKIITKEVTDPFTYTKVGRTGIINVIDLANIDSCAFIETQDLGRVHSDGQFELLGRLDVADIRGCNLMVSDL